MLPDDPRHGTEAGYSAHNREEGRACRPCLKAKLRADKRRRIFGSALIPVPEDVRDILANTSDRTLATQTGVSVTAIYNLKKKGDKAKAYPATIARLRTANIPTDIGTIRRVRALCRLGWSCYAIADRAGEPATTITALRDQVDRKVIGRDSLRYSIARAYAAMCMERPPLTKWSSRVANTAARRGWAAPLAWDNIDLDTAPAGKRRWNTDYDTRDLVDEAVIVRILAGDNIPANRAERLETVRRWVASGRSEVSLCKRMGWHEGRYSPTSREGAA